jgi:hypothetical protein
MRYATCLLFCLTLGVPLASAACGGSITGGIGNDADGGGGGGHDGGTGHSDGGGFGKPDAGGQVDSGTKDAATEAPPVDTSYPAKHPPMPTVASGGGRTVTNPVFIPVTFPSDPSQSDIVAFTNGIGATTFWSTIVTQYGVGAATGGTPVILTEAQEPAGTGSTIDDMAGIQPWLQTQIAAGGALAGTNGANTIYAIYFPSGTTISLEGAQSCNSFGGYHNNFVTSDTGENVTYAVVPRCGSFPTASGVLSGLDAITGPASHEYLEAVTDPDPGTDDAYSGVDNNDFIWELVLGGGEIGDMCAQFPGVFYKPAGFPYTVQRSWSNAAALASHDPCQPSLTGEVYFNAVGELPSITLGGGIGTTTAVSIPLHTTKTINVDLYSDGPTSGPWTVNAFDSAEIMGGPTALSFTWDKTTGQNGDTLHLTITTIADPPQKGEAFVIESTLGATTNAWIGLVQVDPI